MESKKILFISIILLILVSGLFYFFLVRSNSVDFIVGGDRDTHGCIISAGYSWNETKQRCVREWEEVNKIYCMENERNLNVCTTEYFPVCGYLSSNFCDSMACKQTYSNECNACRNSKVEYWISGEC